MFSLYRLSTNGYNKNVMTFNKERAYYVTTTMNISFGENINIHYN